ncbi:CgeB family protein [Halobaculum sp. D14]|uniref:CgeB family protein n=1 Tax=Halobaculum sp. D14 TaxID=3421642 RepID=UPI003EBA375C
MKVLVLSHDYPKFLDWLYDANPGLADAPYETQRQVRAESLFGVTDFYAEALRDRGHDTTGVFVNNGHLQRAWARDHGYRGRQEPDDSSTSVLDRMRARLADTVVTNLLPLLRSTLGDEFVRPSWFYDVLDQQFEHYDPDVVLNIAVDGISSEFLADAKQRHGFLLVGQIAAPLPDWVDADVHDVMTSALPQFVDRFERKGIPSEFVKLAFSESVLDRIDPSGPRHPVTFVGSLSSNHEARIELLERLATEVPLKVWAPGVDHLSEESPLRDCYQGQAWGRDMFEILARSDVVVNNHIGVAGPYAANLRLYETTGVGSFLVTDDKRNLDDIFEPGTEVATYDSVSDCVDTIQYYLEHDAERAAIADAGQQRTLSEHTYSERADQLDSLFGEYTGA